MTFCKSSRERFTLLGRTAWPAVLLTGTFVLVAGCQDASSNGPTAATADVSGMSEGVLQDQEMWDVLKIDQKRVGYGRTLITRESRDGAELLCVEGLSQMQFRRAGQQIALGVEFSSTQTLDGRLLSFESSMSQEAVPIQQTRGEVVGDELRMENTTLGKTVSASIPWKPEFRGPMGSQLSLLQKPMTPGEKRTVNELMPGANVVCQTEMTARDFEPVDVLGQQHQLLRIDIASTFPDGQVQRSTAWADKSGDVLRMHQQAMDMESFRATKQAALADLDEADFDMVLGLSVNVNRQLAHPHDTKRTRYRLHLDEGDPAQVFPSGPAQEIRSIDPHTAEATVYALRPGQSTKEDAGNASDRPSPADLEPNSLIQSDDPKIVAAAKGVSAGQKTSWQLAVALERFVHDKITTSDYSQAFDSAAEVMETGKGDCTEHAVLLAGLARACKIPARVVIGLVYTEQTGQPAFGYHMWDELFIDGRWIPMDATLARGGIGAAHLKLGDTSLEGVSAFSGLLPVAQVAGRLQIEIEDVE